MSPTGSIRLVTLLGFPVMAIMLAMAGCGGGPSSAEPLAAELTASGAPYRVGGPIKVTFSLVNRGEAARTVVRPLVAPNLVEFSITGPDGKELPFDGPWPKLKPLPEEYFVELGPGERASNDFDLAEGFGLSLTRPGRYRVSAVYRNRDDGARFGKTAFVISRLPSNSVEVELR